MTCRKRSKYPPAEPGALVLEPLKAACPCRSGRVSRNSVKDLTRSRTAAALVSYRTCYLHLHSVWLHLPSSSIDGAPFLRVAAHDSELHRWASGFDFMKCQTVAASPAEPGELPFWFSKRAVILACIIPMENRYKRYRHLAAYMIPILHQSELTI